MNSQPLPFTMAQQMFTEVTEGDVATTPCVKCDRTDLVAHGLCTRHYQVARRQGTLGLSSEEVKRKEKDTNLWANHRMRLVDFEIMLYTLQAGLCGLCGKEAPPISEVSLGGKGKLWHVDHDKDCCPTIKSCGQCTRGILCISCNIKLQRDVDVEWILRAARYLKLADFNHVNRESELQN